MIRRIFLVHHTHMDIGYTDQPAEVLNQQLSFLDKAVSLAGKHPSFCWTIESAYLVKEYLRCRRPEACKTLLDLLRAGRFEVGAFEVQPLTELLTTEELAESLHYATQLGRQEGFPVETALLDDIGGYARGLPSAFAANQVRYLLAGVGAFQVFLPWAKLPHLFYWRDASGKRILIWNLGIDRTSSPWNADSMDAVYGMGAIYIVLPYLKHFRLGADRQVEAEGIKKQAWDIEAPDAQFRKFIARLEREGYPYEEILLQYGGDNRWPSDFLPELLDRINAEGTLPPIELVTPSRFFHWMEERYGEAIPELAGALCDPWISRISPSPEPLRAYLSAQRGRQYLETLGETVSDVIKEQSALYADHTCGLSEWHAPELSTDVSPADPVFENLRASWNTKRSYAESANLETRNLLRRALNRRKVGALTLFNCSDAPQGGIVEVTLGRDAAPLQGLTLPDGRPLEFAKVAHQRYWVEVPEAPANAVMPLQAEFGDIPDYFTLSPEQLSPLPKILKTSVGNFGIEAQTGEIRKLTLKNGVEICGKPSLFAMHYQTPREYILSWTQAGMTPIKAWNDPVPEITRAGMVIANGLGWILEQRGKFGDALDYRMRVSIYRNQPFCDVECFLNKPAHRQLEATYLACHLAGQSHHWQIVQHTGILHPEKELLPGAMRDLFFAPCGASFDGKGYTAYMQSPDAPVLHPGSPQLFSWLTERNFVSEPAAFYWCIHHNLHISDCPAWQPILGTFRFRLWFDQTERFHPDASSLIIC